ncbi:hypothetical protein D9R08_10915 [Rhodophyticola porphyridii]|uniref:Uncharacterized protein n=2 Tax=Rhodophyticola porphyridii TaxID=1852017 RepID=A0A3L9Y3T1_9RHOB|nr:hypothetical protein D9R08_10915 [Rhodophyticola porphyridii]
MMLFVAFEIGLPILTLKDLSFGNVVFAAGETVPAELRLWLGVSTACLLLAALCHFIYMRRIHMNAFAVARVMLETAQGADARRLVFDRQSGLWARHGAKYRLGMVFLILGCLAYCGFVWTHIGTL